MLRRRLLIALLSALCLPGLARAQEAAWPARPIRSDKRRRAGPHAAV